MGHNGLRASLPSDRKCDTRARKGQEKFVDQKMPLLPT